jgi:hypothetical protein
LTFLEESGVRSQESGGNKEEERGGEAESFLSLIIRT